MVKINYEKLWKQQSNAYAERNKNAPRNPDILKQIKKAKIKFKNVLQVGCSTGDILNQVTQFFRVSGTGIEPGEKAIQLAKKKHPQLKFVKAFAQSLPFKDEEFDFVIVIGVLSWIPREQIYQAIGEIIRVAKKYILISDFNPSKPYKNNYKHQKGLMTYKIDSQQAFLSLNLLEIIQAQEFCLEDGEWGKGIRVLYRKKNENEAYPLKSKSALIKEV